VISAASGGLLQDCGQWCLFDEEGKEKARHVI
jgi:hypothetical protein